MSFSNVQNKRICENTLSFIFVFFLSFICCMIFAKFFLLHIATRVGLKEKPYVYNAAVDYPYEKEEKLEENNLDKFARFKDFFSSVQTRITLSCTDKLPKRIYGVLLKKRIDKILGLDMTMSMGIMEQVKSGDVVTSFDGEWLGNPLVKGTEENIVSHIQSVVSFGNRMKNEGRIFFVFENPSKFCDCLGYKNYYEENREKVNFGLRSGNIEIFDLDDYIAEHNIDYKDIFLKTDHHWQPRSGLWADSILCEYLNENYSTNIDTSFFCIDNYNIKVYKNQFLGSLGKKVTEVYSAKEDFELITPKFETNLTVFSSATGEQRSGTIPEVFYDLSVFNKKSAYTRNEYALYTNSQDSGLIVSHNNNKSDGSNLLLIHLSFADVQIPFLTQAFENFYAVDLRHFNGSLETLIKEKNPSIVILAYPTTCFQNSGKDQPTERNMFDFN